MSFCAMVCILKHRDLAAISVRTLYRLVMYNLVVHPTLIELEYGWCNIGPAVHRDETRCRSYYLRRSCRVVRLVTPTPR
jgi:hypothetical protein